MTIFLWVFGFVLLSIKRTLLRQPSAWTDHDPIWSYYFSVFQIRTQSIRKDMQMVLKIHPVWKKTAEIISTS